MKQKTHISQLIFVLTLFFSGILHQPALACERCFLAGITQEAQEAASNAIISLVSSPGEPGKNATADLHFFESRDAVIRYRPVHLDDRTKGQGWLKQNDHILLNLFDDVKLEAHIQWASVNVNGTFSITARLSSGDGYMILATTGSRSLGTVFLPESQMFYKIVSDPDTYQHYLVEMDARDRDIIETSPPLIPEINEKDIREQERIHNQLKDKNLGPDDVAHIGVMIVYTQQAAYWANQNSSGIDNIIAMSMSNAQLVLDNSETGMEMTLVHAASVFNYTESGSSTVDLVRLTASPDYNPWGNSFDGNSVPGHMEEVHEWRDKYRASLTAIFTYAYDTGGIAWLLTDRYGVPARGFSMTRVQQAATGYTHIHEMGHNMGLHHHAEQNFQPGPTGWSNWPENRWSAGWRWLGNNNVRYVSVMSYSGGQYYPDGQNSTQVPYFSNPHIVHQGVPAGDPEKADNVRTLREIKHVIAAYRSMGHPGVVTSQATDITATSAKSGGDIVDVSGQEVIERGIIWGRDDNLTISNNEGMASEGSGDGQFVSAMDNLMPSSNYFVRAYAVTNDQVFHGTYVMFSTLEAERPGVNTIQATNIKQGSAMIGGVVHSDGNLPVTERGVVWSTREYPTIESHDGMTVEGTGMGEFVSHVTGLSAETTYYYRSYATNLMGTNYGGHFNFTTYGPVMYPNPADDQLWVEFNNESEETVYVVLTNMYGQVVKRKAITSQGEKSVFFNTSQLRGGIYLVYIESDEKLPVWRLMINRP